MNNQLTKQLIQLFPIPFGVYELNVNLDSVYNALQDFSTGPNYLISGCRSSYNKGKSVLYDEKLFTLYHQITECVNDYSEELGVGPVIITDSWHNEMQMGKRLHLHRHEDSVISGVFYVKSEIHTVPLKFRNPLHPYRMTEIYVNKTSKYSTGGMQFPARKGILYLFPSWLEHETDEEMGPRCVISLNTKYKHEVIN